MTDRTCSARCPYCQDKCRLAFGARDINRRVSAREFAYLRCDGCSLIFLKEPPSDLSSYYPTGYVSIPTSTQALARVAERTRYQIDMLREIPAPGRLLEIGPGFGSFAWLAKSAGFDVEVIESDAVACEHLRSQVGVSVTQSDAPELELSARTSTFDAIVLWHSLEHLPQPWTMLTQAVRVLNPGGVILVATPNPAAWQFAVMGARWPHVDAPRHLWLIPFDVLRGHLESLGLQLVTVTSDDPGGRSWNQFGWSQAIRNLQTKRLKDALLVRAASRALGHALAFAFSPWEQAPLKGSAYTATFRKPHAGTPQLSSGSSPLPVGA